MSSIAARHPRKINPQQLEQQRLAIRRRQRRLFLERLEERSLLATMTWDGSASANWADAANWVGDITPTAGDDLFFPAGAANLTNVNNLPAGTMFNTIVFTGGGYNVTGNAIALNGGLTANNTTGNNSFTPAITVLNAMTLMSANPGTTLTLGALDTGNLHGATTIFGNSALHLDGAGTLIVSGVISGQGSIQKLGTGTAVLQGANTYQGLTDVRQGYLRIENGSALGPAGSGETQVQAGAQLQAAGTFSTPEHITLREGGVGFGNGSDPGTLGALRVLSGTVTWTGNMDLNGGNNLVGVDSGATLIASGVVASATSATLPSNRLIKVGGGTLRLTGTQANVYRGETVVLQGTLELGKTAGLNAIGGNLVIGDNIGGDNAATVRLLADNQIPHIDYFSVGLTSITMNASAAMDFNGFDDAIGNLTMYQGATYSPDIDLNTGTLTFGGTTLTVNTTGLSSLYQGTSGLSPAATIADGTFDLGTHFSGAGGGAFKAINVQDTQLNNIAPDLIISADITGTADVSWNKGGGGTLVLAGNNTFAGPVTLGGGNQGTGIVGVGSNSAFGAGLLSLQGSTLQAFGGNRTISTPFSLENTVPIIGDLDLTFTGSGTLTGGRTIQVMHPDAVVTFAGPIGEAYFGSQNLAKSGRGTLAFTAASTFSGTYTINNDGGTTVLSGAGSLLNVSAITVGVGGVLRLDNTTTNNSNRLNDLTTITLNGELALVGNATANSTEIVGPTTAGDQLASALTVQNTSGGANSVALVLNALGTSGTRMINFRALGGGGDLSATGQNRIAVHNNPGNLLQGVLTGARVTTAAGIELATYGNGPEGIAVIPVPASAYTSDLANAGTLDNVRITTPGTYTLTRSKQINSLIIGPGVTIAGDDVHLAVLSGLTFFTGTGAAALNVESITAGSGSYFVGPGMNASIGGNIISGSVVKTGDGRLALSGDNTFSGNLTINEGIVALQRSSAAGSLVAGTFVRQGATLELEETTFGPVRVGLEPLSLTGVGQSLTGQYSNAIGALRNTAGDNSWAGTITLGGDATDLTAPTLLNGFPVIATATAFISVDAGSRLTSTGTIAGGIEVIKRGAGMLEYAGVMANTYTGATRILDGTLELNKARGINAAVSTTFVGSDRTAAPAATLRMLQSDQMADNVGTFLHSSGNLDVGQTEGLGGTLTMVIAANGAADITIGTGGTLTTNVDLTLMTAGTGHAAGATISGGTVALQFRGIIAAPGARTWQINDGAAGNDLTVNSVIADGTGLQSVGITKNGFGTLEFRGATANTFTGTTTINEGTLLLNKGTAGAGGVNAVGGPISIGDGTVNSGFANADVVRLLQPNQIPDQLAAVTVRNTGLFDLNNNNETIGNVDVQAALTINGGATVNTGSGTLTIIGDITGNPAEGAGLFTPVAVATINGNLNLGTGVPRTINIGDRTELPTELVINANISGAADLILSNSATILFSGNNTLSGNIYRNNGNIAVGSDTALGTGKVFINGGNFMTFNGPRTLANEFVLNGTNTTISFIGSNNLASSGGQNASPVGGGGNNVTFTGPVNVLATAANPTFNISTPVAGVLEFAGGIGESLERVGIRKHGYGTLVFSSAVTLSNGITIGQDPANAAVNGGTVVLRGGGTLFNGNIVVGHNGVFQIDNSAGNLTDRLAATTLIDLLGGTLALVAGSGVLATESTGQIRGRNNYGGAVQVLTSPAPGTAAVWRFTHYAQEGGNTGAGIKFVGRGQNITHNGTSRVALNAAPTLVDGIMPQAVIQGSTGFDFATFVNPSPTITPFDNFVSALTSGPNFATTLAGATGTVNVKLSASETVAAATSANAILLANGGIVVGGAGGLTVDSGLVFSTGTGNQINTPTLALGGAEGLLFVDNGDLNVGSGITGATSSLGKLGQGTAILSNGGNISTYTGAVRVTQGTLRLEKNSALGANTATPPSSQLVTVMFGGTMELANNIVISGEFVTLNGQGEANLNSTPLRSVSGTNVWEQSVVLASGRTAIEVTAGTLSIGSSLTGGIVSGGQGWNKFGAGTMVLAGQVANTNSQQSILWQGTVDLNKSPGVNAIAQALIVGNPTNGGNDTAILRFQSDNQLSDAANYTITVEPNGLIDLNGRQETITPTAATTVLQLLIGPAGSGDIVMGSGGQLTLAGSVATNITIANSPTGSGGGSPAPATISGRIQLNSASTTWNVIDSAAVEDFAMRAVLNGPAPITITGNNGRTVLDPRDAANAVTPNTHDGVNTLSQGELVLRSNGALGNTSGGMIITGGSLLLEGSGTINDTLTMTGAGFGGQGVIRNVSGTRVWAGTVTLSGTSTVGVNGGTSLDFSGAINEAATTLGVTKLLPGNLIYSGSIGNGYTGTTTVNEGTLTLNKTAGTNAFSGSLTIGNDAGANGNLDVVNLLAANQIPDAATITIQSTGRLNLNANSETLGTIAMTPMPQYAPAIASTGAGELVMNGNVSLARVDNTPYYYLSPGARFSGNLNLANATRTFTIADVANNAGVTVGNNTMEVVIDAVINGGGSGGNITLNGSATQGAGFLVLANNNPAYTGTTTINAGGLVVRNSGALGTGPLNFTAALPLITTNYGAAPTTINLPNTINLPVDITIRGDNNLILSGTINGQGAANRTLNLNMNNGATLDITGTLNLSNDGTQRTFILSENTFNHTSTLSGFIRNGSGATNHAFQKGGLGTLVLSGNNNSAPNNDFIGTTTIAAGQMRLGHANALGGMIAEQQSFGVTSGGAGGGSFTITYNGQTTSALNYTAFTPPTAADVATALNALPSIARTGGLVSVTSSNPGGPTTTYTVTFGGMLTGVDVTQISAINVTAPVTVSTAIATPVAGAGGTVVNSGATLLVAPGVVSTEPLTLSGNGQGNLGALRMIDVTPGVTETVTWPANINFSASAWLGVDGGGANPDRLILAGTTVSGGGVTVKTGLGELEFGGNTDNAQVVFSGVSAFDDGLEVRSGTVYLNKPNVAGANYNFIIGAGAVTAGDGGGGVGADRLIIIGSSTDQIGGTAPVNVAPSGLLTMAGGATAETLPAAVTIQRWSNAAGVLDSTPSRTITLNGTVSVTNLGYSDGSTPAAQIHSGISLGAAARTFTVADSLVLNAAEDLVVSGVISGTAAAAGITKDGHGTMAVTAANTYQGTTTVTAATATDGLLSRVGGTLVARNAGVLGTGALTVNEGATLTLNNTAASVNRVADAAAVIMNGRLNLIGNSAGTTEVVGALTSNAINNGGLNSQIVVDSSAGGLTELTLASFTRNAQSSIEFVGVGADLGSTTNSRIQVTGGTNPFTNGVVPWATMRGPAGYDLVTDADGTSGAAPFYFGRVPTASYSTDINSGGIVRLTGGTHTVTGNRNIDALLLENGATINVAAGNNFDLVMGTATAGLIVSATGANSINLGATGELTYGTREPLMLVEPGSTLTVNTLVNSSGAMRLERGGTLVLSGDNDQAAGNQFTGAVVAANGTIRATHSDSLGAGATSGVLVRNFASLSLEAPMTIGNRQLDIYGPGVGNNGALIVTSGNAVTWGAGATVVNLTPPLNLTGATTLDILNIAGTLTLNANVSGSSQLTKIGAGELIYGGTGANSNVQPVNVNEGTLTLNKPPTFQAIGSTVTIEDLNNFDPAGAAVVTYAALSSTTSIIDSATVTINDRGQFLTNGISETIATLNVNGSRIGSDNVATGAGTLTVSGNVTLRGGTTNGNILLSGATSTLIYNGDSFGPGGQAIFAGRLDLNNATRTITVNDNYAVDDLRVTGTIVNGRVLKNGAGSLALTNAGNSFAAGVDEVQTLTIPGTVSAFTLTFNGAVTPIISTISAAAIQTALDTILGAGNTSVTGTGPFNVQFTGILAGVDVAQFTSTVTGGSGTITHATTTAGVAGFNLNAGTLALPSSSPLGGATLNISGNVQIRPIAGGDLDLTNRVVVNPNLTTTLGGRRDFGGNDDIELSGSQIVIVPSVGFNNNYQIDDPAIVAEISGIIAGGVRNVINNNIPLVKTGFGKLILSGANSFVGSVTVSAGILNLRNSLALGPGGLPSTGSPNGATVTVAGLAALELEGGVTIQNRTLQLQAVNPPAFASGYLSDFNGALRSVSGNNTWQGPVDTRTFENNGNVRIYFIGVDAGQLTIDGSITGTNTGGGPVANTLIKTGAGTLVYAGDVPNLLSGTTAVLSGTLALAKAPGVQAIAGTLVVGDNLGTNDTVEIRAAEQILNTAAVQVQSTGRLLMTSGVTAVAAPNKVETFTFQSQNPSTGAITNAVATGGTWQLNLSGGGAVPGVNLMNIPFNIAPSALEELIRQAHGSATPHIRVGGIAALQYTFSYVNGLGGQSIGAASVNPAGLTPSTMISPTFTTLQQGGPSNPLFAQETVGATTILVGDTSSALIDAGAATLALNGDVTVSARPGIATALPAQITGTGFVKLLADDSADAVRTLTVNDGAGLIELSIAPRLRDPGQVTAPAPGLASLTKTGAGRLVLSGANTYSGSTTVSAGALRIQNANALGDTGGLQTTTTVAANAALEFDLTGTNTIDNEQIILNGTGIVNGPITANFTTAMGTGALRNIAGTNTIFEANLNAVNINTDSLIAVDGGRLVIDGVITQGAANRALIKSGPGDLELTGATENNLNGTVLINDGKLLLNKSGDGTRAVGVAAGVLGGAMYIGDTVGGDNSAIVEIGPLSNGTGLFGPDQIESFMPIRISRTGLLNLNNMNEVLAQTITLDVGPTMSADITTGTGALRLATTFASTIVAISQAGVTATSPAATFSGIYDGNGGTIVRTFEARQGPANVELVISAAITNVTQSITKNGRGTIVFSGNNTYHPTPATALPISVATDSGTLVMNTPAGSGLTNITVSPGATLGGSGTINGNVILADRASNLTTGGILNPGQPGTSPGNTGILTVNGNVTFGQRAELFIDLNGTTPGTGHDQLRIIGTGTLTINNTVTGGVNNGAQLNGRTGSAIVAGTGVKVIDKVSSGGFTGTPTAAITSFANAPGATGDLTLGTRNYSYLYNAGGPLGDGNDFVLTAIPSTVEWDGRIDGGAVTASNNWTLPENWVGDSVPAPGDSILFGDLGIGNGKNTPFNDFPALSSFNGIFFANNSGSYTIGGNSITLNLAAASNIISDNSLNIPVTNTIAVPLTTATTAQSITVKDGSTLVLGGPVTMVAAAPLTINNGTGADAAGGITFGGTLNGAATLTLNITGNATFNGAVGGTTALTGIVITNADDVTFNSTVAIAGNINQAAGTGTTTLSGGTISGTLTINNEGAAFAGSNTTVTGNTLINATVSGITQTAGGLITPSLTLTGAGDFLLPQAANDFNTLTANVNGNISIRDTDDLLVSGAGITTSNDDVAIQAGTTLGINAAVSLGTGDLTLTTGAATTQTAAIVGGGLELRGAGPFTLLNVANNVATLAINTTEAVTYTDANAVAIGTVTGLGTVGITTTNDNVRINAGGIAVDGAVALGTGNLTLNASGASTQTAPIVAAGLELLGAGPYALNDAGNDVATIAANTTGAVSYNDSNALNVGTVNTVGVTTDNDNVVLSAGGNLTLTAAITAPTAIVGLISVTGNLVDGNAATNNVTAGALAAAAATGVGTSADPIESTVSGIEADSGSGGVFIANTGVATIGGVTPLLSGVAVTGGNINISSTGGLAITESVTNPTGTVTLNGGTGAISTPTAAIDVIAPDLIATAALGIDLDTTVTNVTLTNTGAGNVRIDETDALNIAGLSVANGGATLNAAGPLTNGAAAVLNVSGNASFSGTTVTLGNQPGDNLSLGGLAFTSTGAVNIELNNATAFSGASTADTLNLTSTSAVTNTAGASLNVTSAAVLNVGSATLGNQAGDAFNFGTLNFTSPGLVSIEEDSSTDLVGVISAGSGNIISTGAISNAPSSTLTIAGLGTFGGTTVSIGNTAGDTFNAGSVGFVSTGAVTITEDSATDLAGTSAAGTLLLTSPGAITSSTTANVNVTGSATLLGTSINIGNTGADVINFGTLTFTASTGGASIAENSSLDLLGANTAPGAIVLTAVDAASAGQDLVLPVGSSVVSTTSSVTLNAGDNAVIGGNVTSALSTTINIEWDPLESTCRHASLSIL